MLETNYKSPFLLIEDVWGQLSSSEKSLCLNYKKQIEHNWKVSPGLIMAINEIHEKYKDFHMGCIPYQITAMTQDLSGYEPKDIA